MATEITVLSLPLATITIPAGGIHPMWKFSPEQIEKAVRWGALHVQKIEVSPCTEVSLNNRSSPLAYNFFVLITDVMKARYDHHFENRERERRVDPPLPLRSDSRRSK